MKSKPGRTRLESVVETTLNFACGYIIAVCVYQTYIVLNGPVSELSQNLEIGIYMTGASVVRSYTLSRVMNKLHTKIKRIEKFLFHKVD